LRLIADDLGYSRDRQISVPTVSHYREKDGADVYNIVVKVETVDAGPEIAFEN